MNNNIKKLLNIRVNEDDANRIVDVDVDWLYPNCIDMEWVNNIIKYGQASNPITIRNPEPIFPEDT